MLRETEPYCQAPSAPCRRSLSNHSYLIVIINIDSVFSLEDKPYEGRDCTAKKLNRNLCSRLMCVYRYIYMNKRMRVRKGGKEGGGRGKGGEEGLEWFPHGLPSYIFSPFLYSLLFTQKHLPAALETSWSLPQISSITCQEVSCEQSSNFCLKENNLASATQIRRGGGRTQTQRTCLARLD